MTITLVDFSKDLNVTISLLPCLSLKRIAERIFLQRFFYSAKFSPMQEKILFDLVEKLKRERKSPKKEKSRTKLMIFYA